MTDREHSDRSGVAKANYKERSENETRRRLLRGKRKPKTAKAQEKDGVAYSCSLMFTKDLCLFN